MTTTMPQKRKSSHDRRNEAYSDKLQPLWGRVRSSGPVSPTREKQRSMGHRQKWEKRNLNEMKIIKSEFVGAKINIVYVYSFYAVQQVANISEC